MSRSGELPAIPVPAAPPLSAELEAELVALHPVRMRRPLRQLAMLVGASLVYGAGIAAMTTLRRDLGELPIGWLIGATLAWLLGFVVPLYLATVPRPGSMMPRWQLAGAASVVGSVAFIGLGLAIHPSGPSSVQHGWPHLGNSTCFEVGVAAAIVPVILGAVFLRGALPVGSRWIAAALGAGGGSLGGLVLHLHCAVTDALHVGLVHGGAVGVSALVAAAIVPRVTEVRARR